MAIYVVTFVGQTISVEQDLWDILAPSDKRIAIRQIDFGQYTDFTDAQAELIPVRIIRGYTAAGSGGSAVTPVHVGDTQLRDGGYKVAGATVKTNNTTLASGGTSSVLRASTFNVAAGFWHDPRIDERIMCDVGERLVLRMGVPADPLTMNGTLVFEEL